MKPTVPEVAPIVRSLYARHSAGCCWHVVLDDGNVGRETVLWVVNGWLPDNWCGEPECKQLAELLPRMSPTQLRKLGALAHRSIVPA